MDDLPEPPDFCPSMGAVNIAIKVYARAYARAALAARDDARDAERYRWLRDAPLGKVEVFFATDANASGWGDWSSWTDKDAAIDAARGKG